MSKSLRYWLSILAALLCLVFPAAQAQQTTDETPHVNIELDWAFVVAAGGIFGHDIGTLRLNPGVILVRDFDGVYDDQDDPAVRQKITITPIGSPTNSADLERSNDRVRLYDAEKGARNCLMDTTPRRFKAALIIWVAATKRATV